MSSPWYIARGKQKVGPHTYEEVRRMAAEDRLLPSDMVFNEGSTRWVSAGDVPGLTFGSKKEGPTDVPERGKPDEWYFARNGQRFGPFAFEQLRQMAASGLLSADDMIQSNDGCWASAGTVSGLFGESPGIPLAKPVRQSETPAIPLAMPVRDGESPGIPLAMQVRPAQSPPRNPARPVAGIPLAAPVHSAPLGIEARPVRGVEPPAGTRPLLWNPNAASSWSFLFTPAFGAWLHAANWRALGRPGKARMSMVWVWLTATFLAFGLVLPFLPFLPVTELRNGGMGGVGLLMFVVWYFTQGAWHAKYVEEHFGDDYTRRGWSVPLLAVLAASAGYCALIYGLVLAAYAPDPAKLAATVKPLILQEWQKVPELRNATIQDVFLVHKDGKTYTGFVNATVGGRAARLTLEVVADRGNILWKIEPSSSAPDHGTLVEIKGSELYYTPAVTEEEARKLGEFLDEKKWFDSGRASVQLNKSDGTYEVRLVVKKGIEQDPEVWNAPRKSGHRVNGYSDSSYAAGLT